MIWFGFEGLILETLREDAEEEGFLEIQPKVTNGLDMKMHPLKTIMWCLVGAANFGDKLHISLLILFFKNLRFLNLTLFNIIAI